MCAGVDIGACHVGEADHLRREVAFADACRSAEDVVVVDSDRVVAFVAGTVATLPYFAADVADELFGGLEIVCHGIAFMGVNSEV